MALSIRRSGGLAPLRVVIHGPPGAGKTSLAARIPGVLFITTPDEDGLGDHSVQVQDVESWWGLLDVVEALIRGEGGPTLRTVVIDTISTMERRLQADLCRQAGVQTIEEVGGGYGRGATMVGEQMTHLCSRLEAMRRACAVNVVLLCHSEGKTFRDPAGAEYDQWQLNVGKKARAAIEAWADIIGCAHEVVETGRRQEARRVKSSRRELVLGGSAAFVVKTRLQLPPAVPLGWEHLTRALEAAGRPWDGHRAAQPPQQGQGMGRLAAVLRARLDALRATGYADLMEAEPRRLAVMGALAPVIGAPPGADAPGLVEALPLERLAALLVEAGVLAAPPDGGEE
ncbi:MAG: ATP-binding protein [Rhodobacteraceae bacterium]|nr:ATP-binding protein [Paracoccaceae bacterium]